MVEEKTTSYVDDVISACSNAISKIKTSIASIEEKYKKLKEEESASLNEQLEQVNAQYHYWLTVRGDLPKEEKKTRTRRTKKTEETPAEEVVEETTVEDAVEETVITEEEVVKDTLFPENNEPEEADNYISEQELGLRELQTGKTIEEELNESPVEEEDQGPEFDGAGFSDADREAPETTEESWPAEESEETEKEVEEKDSIDGDEWPEFPEEWK